MNLLSRPAWWFAVPLALLLAACTSNHYRRSADNEVYAAIQAKSKNVEDMDARFTIEQTNKISLERLPQTTNAPEFLGPYGAREVGARVLRLEDALGVGVATSRSYQSRKEQLYLSGLSLTLARHQFAPLFSGSGNVDFQVQPQLGTVIEPDPITGLPTVVTTDNIVEQQSVTGSGSLGASWLIRDVGRITAAATADFLRFVSGNPALAMSSQLGATFTRPLLRDANFKQETENLTQAERQLLYDLRDFTRYRKDFSVQIATSYYGVLGDRDAVRNSFLNFQSSRKNAERGRAMGQEGRMTQSDLGRLEQQELSAESVWNNGLHNYQQSLDNLKFQLGLPVDAHIVLEDQELQQLRILDPDLSVEDSINIALVARLDYANAKDQLADAERKVKVAANFLKPQADLVANVAVPSNPSAVGVALPEPSRYSWSAGLNFDLGLDRLAERNNFRASLIARDQAARALEQQEDQVRLQVRESWRTLDQAKRNYQISDVGVQIAERRLEEQNLLSDLGRAKAQDLVDAQNALIDSKNQLTQALVTHTIARLQFWDNLGILYLKDNGQWEEIQNAKTE
ncbi:Outer membrane protein-like protein [Verrucomicrobia bacterium]|nr:Outer membrane protein-like protein [Verrucomicrobiota bacterium]